MKIKKSVWMAFMVVCMVFAMPPVLQAGRIPDVACDVGTQYSEIPDSPEAGYAFAGAEYVITRAGYAESAPAPPCVSLRLAAEVETPARDANVFAKSIYKLKTSGMQSLKRALRRGEAVIYYNTVVMQRRIMYKRGATPREWRYALDNKV
jgi:hypothetical protein